MNTSAPTIPNLKTKTIYEPFVAAFTGWLKSYISANGMRYSLAGKGIRIEKGNHYMIKMVDSKVYFLPVLIPDFYDRLGQ